MTHLRPIQAEVLSFMAILDHALVVADGDVDVALLAELARATDPPPLLIAADGGAARVLAAGLMPGIVVGDFDSLAEADRAHLEELGVELRVADRDKDESDMELCLLTALGAGVDRVTILGALGVVRPEHSVANLLLLADPRLDEIDVAIAGRGSRICRIGTAGGGGEAHIEGEAGDFVSLFALGGSVEGVSTTGLRFSLTDETLCLGPSRGLSNELLGHDARVTSRRGCLLVIHTHRSMSDAPPTGWS
ncbi:MAG: thiamine diphosphokinase [Chloroflexota bacterium]|nr:thiamine diphosphokinase [Chloroflexota bacterium]